MKKIILMVLVHSAVTDASLGELLSNLFQILRTHRNIERNYEPMNREYYIPLHHKEKPEEEKQAFKRRLFFCLLCCIPLRTKIN